ncbi:hypothetical protein [Acrocarpospora corrugata]|uniref:hypothetical protein n=1 Tax=Acrocarpospora corrugata TaxID=35763 RepID=UPI0012D34429|nr:hypothetical protein [Acrocarpospora corrugata]
MTRKPRRLKRAGTLSVSAPGTVQLGGGTAGQTVTAQLGPVLVEDTRGALAAAWVAQATATDFKTGAGTAAETSLKPRLSYWSGPATRTTGTGVFTPGQLTALLAAPMRSTVTAFTRTLGAGNDTARWNPHIVVNLPSGAVAGTYTGKITHSVA